SQRARAHLYVGIALLGLGDEDRARTAFSEACRTDGSLTLGRKEFSSRVRDAFGEAARACTPSTRVAEATTAPVESTASMPTPVPVPTVAPPAIPPAQAGRAPSANALVFLAAVKAGELPVVRLLLQEE